MASTATEFPPSTRPRSPSSRPDRGQPTDAKLRGDLGKLYYDSGLYQDAVGYFEQALEIAPDDVGCCCRSA